MSQPEQLLEPRRSVPRTDAVLADPRIVAAARPLDAGLVLAAVRAAQDLVRDATITSEDVVDAALARMPTRATSLHPVLNATGVVLHTNLGRAPLSGGAIDALASSAGYVDVEFDRSTGRRGGRGDAATAALLRRVPGAESALIVNNGAAALLLVTAALAPGRDVVVSRGEMVEIGDGFRLPDLLVSAGAVLREVGTTNRTHVRDYAQVIGADTAFVLKVHPSNFVVTGFTSSASVRELAGTGSPVVVDIGSGLLAADPLLPGEPDAASALAAGAAIVTASGDKLLGGPQAGLILGRADLLARLRRHPMYRAVRVDKLTLAALEATLNGAPTPTHVALHATAGDLRDRADAMAAHLLAGGVDAVVVSHDGVVGGGGAPGVTLPGWAVAVSARLASPLRETDPCVVGVVERDRFLLDPRCLRPSDDAVVSRAVLAAAASNPRCT